MKQFTFSKLNKMGDFDEKYGQAYWGEPNEQLEPVKFNSMNQDITMGDTVTCEEVLLKTSSKGTDYHQLKKVKVVDTTEAKPENAITPGPTRIAEATLQQILELAKKNNRILKELKGEDIVVDPDTFPDL